MGNCCTNWLRLRPRYHCAMLNDLDLDLSEDAKSLLARLVSAEPDGLIASELQIGDGGFVDAAIELADLWLLAADAPVDADADLREWRRQNIIDAEWTDIIEHDADRLREWLLEGDMRIRVNEMGLLLGWIEDVERLPRPFGFCGAATPAREAFQQLIESIQDANYWLHCQYNNLGLMVAPEEQPSRRFQLHAFEQGWSRSLDKAIDWLAWFAAQEDLQSARTWCSDSAQILTAFNDFNFLRPGKVGVELLDSVNRIAVESSAMLSPIDRHPPIKWTAQTIEPHVANFLRRRPGATREAIAKHFGCAEGLISKLGVWKNRNKFSPNMSYRSSKQRSLEHPEATEALSTKDELDALIDDQKADDLREHRGRL